MSAASEVDVPDVSVVIPCFNQGRFLRDSVDSVLSQRTPPGQPAARVEIIVVNDGSTDETRTVAAEYGDRIRYIETKNSGVCAARNTGVQASHGAFLHFLDADDWIAPDFYALLLAAAAKNPAIDVVFGSCRVTDEAKNPVWTLIAKNLADGHPLHVWLTECYFSVHAPLVRRHALSATELWDSSFKSTEDWDFWIRVAAAGATFLAVPEALCMYRKYGGSKSTNFEQIYRNGTRMLRSHNRHHPNCRLCKSAIKTGLRNFRSYCVSHAYWYCFGEIRRRQGMLAAARYLGRTCRDDPNLLAEVVRHFAQRLFMGRHAEPLAPQPAPHLSQSRPPVSTTA